MDAETCLDGLSKPDLCRFHAAFVRACPEGQFFVPKSGYMGMGPESVKDGDLVVILFGGNVPYVLRCTGPRCYALVGERYVPGANGRAGCRAVERARFQTGGL